jgi:hypothetical protein
MIFLLVKTIAVLYLDDIVVFGKSFEDYLCNLGKVFDRLSEAGLKLKPKKCQFLQEEISFLGHIVSKSAIRTDPAKVAAVKEIYFLALERQLLYLLPI